MTDLNSLRAAEHAAQTGAGFDVVAILLRPSLIKSARQAVADAALCRRSGAPGPAAGLLATAATLRRMARKR